MNPWLTIPLHDYESHMESVHQDRLLRDVLKDSLAKHAPSSVCVIGCAGGNGFDIINASCRVCGIDINPAYIETARSRYAQSFAKADFIEADIQDPLPDTGQFDLVYAGLIFEYVTIARAAQNIAQLLNPGGALVAVVQLPTEGMREISPSPYKSLNALDGNMKLVDSAELSGCLRKFGLVELSRKEIESELGKRFCVLQLTTK